jgi:hypothetical protein
METPKEYHYTYYSYEEWGRGYFGSRTCKCLPEEDIEYFGSFSDKNFKPTQKIILKGDYSTREDANADEIVLHDYYDVGNNPHFANKSKQTSNKFCYFVPREDAIRNGKIGGNKSKELGSGIHALTFEQKSQAGKKGAQKTIKMRIGIHGRNEEQRKIDAKKGGDKAKELGVGIHSLDEEQRKNHSKKIGKRNYELGIGIASITPKQKIEYGKRGGKTSKENNLGIFSLTEDEWLENRKKGGKITNSQRWMCLETEYITTPGALTNYQRAKGIDTSKRVRIS